MCTVVHSCCKNTSTTGIKYNSYTTGKYLIHRIRVQCSWILYVYVLRTHMHEITFNIVECTCLSASIMLTNVPIQRITVMVSPLIFNIIVTVSPVILRMVNPWITSVVAVGTHDFTWTTLEHVSWHCILIRPDPKRKPHRVTPTPTPWLAPTHYVISSHWWAASCRGCGCCPRPSRLKQVSTLNRCKNNK